MPKLIVPEVLQKYTFNKAILELTFFNKHSLLSELKEKFPSLFNNLFNKKNVLNGYVALYKENRPIDIDDESCLFLAWDSIEIIVPMSGG